MGKADLRCWSSSSWPLWPVMSLLKGLITVMPGGKVVQRPDGWLESWFASTKGFDVAVKLVLTSRVCLIIKSWHSVCTSVYWLQTRIKVLYCSWSIKIFYKTWSERHNYLTFSITHCSAVGRQHYVDLCRTSAIKCCMNTNMSYMYESIRFFSKQSGHRNKCFARNV